jgi:prephenate dehydrogenase
MKSIFMEAEEHDRHVAYVSHLSHVSSFLLGQTVLDIEKDEKNIFDLAGSGFASTVRLAKSSPDMWAPIFEQNVEYLSQALLEYIMHLQRFHYHLMKRDSKELHRIMSKANEIRRVLDNKTEKTNDSLTNNLSSTVNKT